LNPLHRWLCSYSQKCFCLESSMSSFVSKLVATPPCFVRIKSTDLPLFLQKEKQRNIKYKVSVSWDFYFSA
jgi:hypothetical protein